MNMIRGVLKIEMVRLRTTLPGESQTVASYIYINQPTNCRKMNTFRFPMHNRSLKDLEIYKHGGFPDIYVMSRIEGLSQAIIQLSDKFSQKHSVSEIIALVDSGDCDALKDLEYLVCDPVLLGLNYKKMPKLKLAYSTFAGVDPLFEMITEKPNFILARHSHEDFGEQMGEYIMSQVLNIEKNYRKMWEVHHLKSWIELVYTVDKASKRHIKDLQLGILGVGNMGQAIARFFKPHGTALNGLSRTPRKPSEFGYFDKISSSLTEVISNADYIINTLPSTHRTVGMLDGDVLQVCQRKPVFINVGRGSIIQENTLLKALNNSWLSHAVLDVFPREPFPPESMLWNSEKFTITPHCAAISFPQPIAEDFLMTLLRYQQQKPLENVVDWDRGY